MDKTKYKLRSLNPVINKRGLEYSSSFFARTLHAVHRSRIAFDLLFIVDTNTAAFRTGDALQTTNYINHVCLSNTSLLLRYNNIRRCIIVLLYSHVCANNQRELVSGGGGGDGFAAFFVTQQQRTDVLVPI